MKRYILSEQMPDVPESFASWNFDDLDVALLMMYSRYVKYIYSSKTSYIWLFEEVDGERSLLSSCECNPLFFDDKEEST